MALVIPVVGFVVGLLIGLTSVGTALMLPFLILALGMSPVSAVGTNLVYTSVTKVLGAYQHYRQDSVHLGIALWLGFGSIPGALLAVKLVSVLKGKYGPTLDAHLKEALGAVLILVSLVTLFRLFLRGDAKSKPEEVVLDTKRKILTILAGALTGFLVGITSLSSGTLVVATLSLLYPLSGRAIVGTDVFHAAILVSVAAVGYTTMWGNIGTGTAGLLLMGSIPGVLIGSQLTIKVPNRALQAVLSTILLLSGAKLL